MSPFARAWENPVVFRTIVSDLTGRRLACILGISHVALGALLIVFLGAAVTDWNRHFLFTEVGQGRYLHSIMQAGIFGLIVILVPLRLSRLIDGVRREGCFDEVVASGISPLRIAAGGWIVGAGYVGFLLLTTFPYAAFCLFLGDLGIGEVAAAYGVQIAYAMVIILLSLAAAILLGARATSGVSVLVGGLGVLGIFEIPAVAAWFTPVRFFLGPILTSSARNLYAPERVKVFLERPTLYLTEVPAWIYGPALWILLAVAALCLLFAGPAHEFRPGLNSFGAVGSGRPSRGAERRPRFAPLLRWIEVAFLYRNLPPRWSASGFLLRALALCAAFLPVAAVGIGLAYEPQLVERVKTQRIALRALGCIVAPLAILDIIAVQGAGLRRRMERVGPVRGSRGVWWDLLFVISLGLCFLLAFGPALLGFESTGRPLLPGERRMEDLLPSLTWGFAILALFLAELHLFARALSYLFVRTSHVRIACVIVVAIVLLLPALLLEPLRDAKIGGEELKTAIWLFPIPAVQRAAALRGILDLPLIAVHGYLLSVLIVANVILALQARHKLAGAIGLSILLCLPAPAAFAGEAPIDLRVVPGIGGLASQYSCNPLVVEISNRGSEPVRGDLRISEPEGRAWTLVEGIEVSPGSTVRRRVLVIWYPQSPARIEFTGERIRVERSLAPTDVMSVRAGAIHIASRPREFALPGPKPELPIPVAPCRPEYLPEASLAYHWAILVFLGDADPNEWDPAQVAALEGYVRSGGTFVISGGRRPAAFYSSQVVARWIGTSPPPRESDPMVREIPFGLGRIVLCRIDLSDPSIDESLRRTVTEKLLAGTSDVVPGESEDGIMPRQWPGIHGVFLLHSISPHGMSELKIPAAFFIVYAASVVLAAALMVRKRGLSCAWAITGIVILFSAGAAGAISLLERSPTRAAVATICRYGPSMMGRDLVVCRLASAGRTKHRVSAAAPNIEMYRIKYPSWPTIDATVDPRAVSLDVGVPRWGNIVIFGISDASGPPPLRIRAVWKKPRPLLPFLPRSVLSTSGTVQVRIERTPDYGGPMPIAYPRLEEGSAFRVKDMLSFGGPPRTITGRRLTPPSERLEQGPFALFAAMTERPVLLGECVATLDPVLRGEVLTAEFRAEDTKEGVDDGRGPPLLLVQYAMPPETGPKVEGEGLAFEPPIRIIQQVVELEEE